MSIVTRIFAFFALSFALVTVGELASGLQQRSSRLQALREDTLQHADIMSLDIGRVLEGTHQLLATIAKLPADNERWDQRTCRMLEAMVGNDFKYDHIASTDSEGRIVCSSGDKVPVGRAMPDRALFDRVVSTKRFHVGSYGRGLASGNELIRVGYPVLDQADNVLGIVYAGINLTWLNTALNTALSHWPLGRDIVVEIADRDGTLVAHYPNPAKVGQPVRQALRPFVDGRAAGLVETKDEDGVSRLFAYVPAEAESAVGVSVFVGPPSAIAVADIERSILRTVGLTLGGLLLSVALAIVQVRRFLQRPFQNLLATAARWRAGDWSARTAGKTGIPEFDRLSSAFDSLAAEVEERDRSLKYRDVVLHALTSCAADLVTAGSLQQVLPAILGTLGTAIEAQRITVLRLLDDGRRLSMYDVWQAPTAQPALTQELIDKIPTYVPPGGAGQIRPLHRKEPVSLVRSQVSGAVAQVWDILGIKSNLQAPINVDGALWGHLAVDEGRSERVWNTTEVDAVRVLANLIGATIEKAAHLAQVSNADEIVRNSPAIVYRISGGDPPTLTYLSENISLLGHQASALLAEPAKHMTLVHPDDRAKIRDALDALKIGGPAGVMEFRLADAQGNYHWLENRYHPIRNNSSRLIEVAGVLVDTTERRTASDNLQFANTLLKTQQETSPDAILVIDRNKRIVSFNQRFIDLWGLARDVVAAGDDVAVLAKVNTLVKDPEAFRSRVAHLYAHSKLVDHDEIELVDGRWLDRHTAPLQTADGLYLGRIWFFRDITERHTAERVLADSENRFRTILQATSDGVAVIDGEKQCFVLGNQALSDMLGYTQQEFASLPLSAVYMPQEMAGARHRIELVIAGERTLGSGVRLHRKDGTPVSVDVSAARMDLGGRALIVAVYRDVTERQRMQSELQQERDFSAALIDGLPGIFFVLDSNGRNVRFNAGLSEATGRSVAELTGADALLNIAECDRATAAAKIRAVFAGVETAPSIEVDLLTAGGGSRRYLINASRAPLKDGPGIVGVGVDVTDARRTERMLRTSEQRIRAILSAVSDGIFVREFETGRLLEANDSACDMFGYSREELLTRDFAALSSGVPPYTEAEALRRLERARSSNVPITFEWQHKTKSGDILFTEVTVRKVAFGEEHFLLSTIHNITERKRDEGKILEMARFDRLTGLANRAVFAEAIEKGIAAPHHGGGRFAVLYLDLDHFKDVNDTLGHPIGDELLRQVAERLSHAVRRGDTVARFGGDEFAVMQADVDDPADAGQLAERLLLLLDEPYLVGGNELRCGASIGIAVCGPDATDAETLLSRADVALYRAKSEGRGTYRFFTAAMDEEVRTRVNLGNELRRAIGSSQVYLEYQPQVDIETGRILGVEALARWHHPTLGQVSPSVFIPVAERNGLIGPFERWALHEACRQSAQWRAAGIELPTLAVNVSALRFKAATLLEDEIINVLQEFDLPRGHLELELTESVLMDASQHHNDMLVRLRDRGVRLAIDDFGTGYSSLDYLRRFPVDRMKIAQNFILDLGVKEENAVIVRAAIGLARELGISVLAEGVESETQLKLLQEWGCRAVQGFYFARPMSPQQLEPLLRQGHIAHMDSDVA